MSCMFILTFNFLEWFKKLHALAHVN